MTPGKYFGEIALITNQRRTATLKTKTYCNVGWIEKETFDQMITIFPDIKNKMKQNLILYQDKFRCWQKFKLLNVDYLRNLSIETYEELIIYLNHENFQAGEQILNQGMVYDKVYILASGEIELYFKLKDKEVHLDTLNIQGCVLNQISNLFLDKIGFSARAKDSVTVICITLQDL